MRIDRGKDPGVIDLAQEEKDQDLLIGGLCWDEGLDRSGVAGAKTQV